MTIDGTEPATLLRATPIDPLGTPQGFVYLSECAHCGRVVERVIGESRWSHVESQTVRCPISVPAPSGD